jgi:hypothetical protein
MRIHQTTTRDLQRRSNADLRSDPVALHGICPCSSNSSNSLNS